MQELNMYSSFKYESANIRVGYRNILRAVAKTYGGSQGSHT